MTDETRDAPTRVRPRVELLDQPHPTGGYDRILHWSGQHHGYYLGGDLHRLDGPAHIGVDGTLTWHVYGREHNATGPAVVYPDGQVEYWIDGRRVSATLWREMTS